MKNKLTIVILALSSVACFGQLRTNLTACFDYPPSGCSTTITFHWFSSTDLSLPMSNWTHFAQEQCVVGKTNYTVNVPVIAASRWVYAAASNQTGIAPFPGSAEVGPTLRTDVTVLAK